MASNNVKLNDKLKNRKMKPVKQDRYVSEEENEIKRFIIILVGIIVIIGLIYFLSDRFIKKDDTTVTNDNVKTGEIDYNSAAVGMILNRPEKEYYVIIYDQSANSSSLYASVASKYQSKEDALKIYYCDLGNELNKNYVAGDKSSNPDAKKIEDFKFGEITLLKISNGKVTKYIEELDTIRKELS